MIIDLFKVFILSLVEGLTEFLPVSSTGHMIIVDSFIHLSTNRQFVNAFNVIIQLGAILAVVYYFWDKIYPLNKKFKYDEKIQIIKMWSKIIVGVIPAVILGVLFDEKIEKYFFNPITVSITLFLYGIILIIVEKFKNNQNITIKDINNLSFKKALLIGFFQCLAMIPGTSRSAATIIGGMLLGLNRVSAAEFSFFLAIPTMFGATILKIIKLGNVLTGYEWSLIFIGTFLSFIFSLIVIKKLMGYIQKNNFSIFGYYRCALSIIILTLYFTGVLS